MIDQSYQRRILLLKVTVNHQLTAGWSRYGCCCRAATWQNGAAAAARAAT